MKYILIILFSFSFCAFADDPISVKEMTCEELNTKLDDEGVVYVKVFLGRFDIYSEEYVVEERPCWLPDEYTVRNYMRTKDKWSCWAGYKCEWRRPYP